MSKISDLDPGTPDGTEELAVDQGPPGFKTTVRMTADQFAQAGTRWTQAELVGALLTTILEGAGIHVASAAGGTKLTVSIADNAALSGTPTAPTADAGTSTNQIATTAFVEAVHALLATAIASKQPMLVEGAGIDLIANADGTVTINSTATGGGGGIADGIHGDVIVSGAGTVFTLSIANEELYGAGWNGDAGPPTKNALYAKLEALTASIGGKIASGMLGAPNGVATLDGAGKVPAAQLPSFVDDVLEFGSVPALPNPGEAGKIYVTLDTSPNRSWRWSGSGYVEIAGSPGTTDNVPEGPTNRYYTDVRVRAAPMTGLAAIGGVPAAADSLLTVLSKLYGQAFVTIPANFASLNGDNNFAGMIAAQTPNAGTTGGIRLKGNATSGWAFLQVLSADMTAQWGYGRFAASGEFYWSGSFYAQGDISSASDRRLKKDVRPIEGALELVKRLQGNRFTMIETDQPSLGVIADEMKEVLPELVAENAAGFLGVDYGKIAAVLIEAVKELALELETLKARAA